MLLAKETLQLYELALSLLFPIKLLACPTCCNCDWGFHTGVLLLKTFKKSTQLWHSNKNLCLKSSKNECVNRYLQITVVGHLWNTLPQHWHAVVSISAGLEGTSWNAVQLLCHSCLNGQTLTALSVQQFLARHQVTALSHPPIPLPCHHDSFLLPWLKWSSLQWCPSH
jgi:hypothetical protein